MNCSHHRTEPGIPARLFEIRGLEESSVYQYAFQKGEAMGRVEGALEVERTILLRQGRTKFGPPDEQVEAKIAALSDLDRLEELIGRILDVASWEELLADSSNQPG